jgi:hypothetical protein
VARTFYRIIKGASPTLEDFRSHKQAGKRLRDASRQREWAEGISVYPDEEHTK